MFVGLVCLWSHGDCGDSGGAIGGAGGNVLIRFMPLPIRLLRCTKLHCIYVIMSLVPTYYESQSICFVFAQLLSRFNK